MLYDFQTISSCELMQQLAQRLKERRLEKGLTRKALSQMSGVPEPTIVRFERDYAISLHQYLDIVLAMGYTDDIKDIMRKPIYNTLEELEQIHKNKNRKRGSNTKNK